MRKYIIFIFSIILTLALYINENNNLPTVTFCDVGQGDATLISINSTQILIDAGKNSKVLECLENNMTFWDKKIEYFVLTHMDSDHIGGVTQVLDYYKVDFLFINPSNKKSSDFNLLERAVSREMYDGMRVIHTFVGQYIRVNDGVELKVISPNIDFPQVDDMKIAKTERILSDSLSSNIEEKLEKITENNLSIALNVEFGNVNLILPGDLEGDAELAMITMGVLNRSSMLKAGHHGSKSSSTPGFIKVLQPEITIISSGENNAYGHPNSQVIDMFTGFGVNIYQTSKSGELSFATNGNRFWQISD